MVTTSAYYKRLKKLAVVLFVGFLGIAPPGTMIGLFLILGALVGYTWLILGLAIALPVALYIFIRRRKQSSNKASADSGPPNKSPNQE
jgi:hypothetical protein